MRPVGGLISYVMIFCFLCEDVIFAANKIHSEQQKQQSVECTQRVWAGADYVYMWMKDSPATEPLVIAGPPSGLGFPILNQPGVEVVLGDKEISNGGRSGFQFNVGSWLEQEHVYGLQASYFFLSGKTNESSFKSSPDGSPVSGVSFFDVVTQSESGASLSSDALELSAATALRVHNWIQSADLSALFCTFKSGQGLLNVFSGFFWLNFREKMTFSTSSPRVSVPSDIWQTQDQFRTNNNFYGGQVGLEGRYQWDRFFLKARGRVGLGAMVAHLNIQGEFTTNEILQTVGYTNIQEFTGGYYAMPTNIGSYRKSFFSVIPQISVQAGYCLRDWCNLHLGYQFLYVSKLMWASNQIDRNINPSQSTVIKAGTVEPLPAVLSGPEAPEALFRTSDFWVQGLTAGVEFSF